MDMKMKMKMMMMFLDRHAKPHSYFKLSVIGVVVSVASCAVVSYVRQRNSENNTNGNERILVSIDEGLAITSGLKDGLVILQNDDDALVNIVHSISAPQSCRKIETTFSNVSEKYCSSESSCCEEVVLLKDFNHESDHEPESGSVINPTQVSINFASMEAEMEQKIAYFNELFLSLLEKERSLEIQMLEYYGHEEQEDIIRELEDQLKANLEEVKCLSVKVETLQDENQRLKLEASEHLGIVQELETSRTQTNLLKWRLNAIRAEAKEKISSLEKKISILQEKHDDGQQETDNLTRQKELEDEVTDLRSQYSILAQEKLELSRNFESAQALSVSLQNSQEELLEKLELLREEKDMMEKKIEQLQTDRCTEIDELLHLKCLNDFLSCEIKDPRFPLGKTTANNSMRFKLEEKAKDVILDCVTESGDGKNPTFSAIELVDTYSTLGPKDDYSDETQSNTSSTRRNSKRKIFDKLKKLVGKDGQNCKTSMDDKNEATNRRKSVSTNSTDDGSFRNSCESFSSCFTSDNSLEGSDSYAEEKWKNKSAWLQISFKPPNHESKLKKKTLYKDNRVSRSSSDLGTPLNQRNSVSGNPEKARLNQFTKASNIYQGRVSLS